MAAQAGASPTLNWVSHTDNDEPAPCGQQNFEFRQKETRPAEVYGNEGQMYISNTEVTPKAGGNRGSMSPDVAMQIKSQIENATSARIAKHAARASSVTKSNNSQKRMYLSFQKDPSQQNL